MITALVRHVDTNIMGFSDMIKLAAAAAIPVLAIQSIITSLQETGWIPELLGLSEILPDVFTSPIAFKFAHNLQLTYMAVHMLWVCWLVIMVRATNGLPLVDYENSQPQVTRELS